MTRDNSREFELSKLTALSPLDGSYWGKVKDFAPYMSEYGLIYLRVLVKIKWLLKLSQIPEVTEVPSFSEEAQSYLQGLIDGFSMNDALEVKKIEKVTNHDAKAVEYFLKEKCQSHPEIYKKEALNAVIFPVMEELIKAICNMAMDNAEVPMLSPTHGQPASPTMLV